MSTAIHLDSVTVDYQVGGEPAVADIDLDVAEGECVLLTGGSGCGKSTLLRLLNGLVPHVHEARITGTVQVLGQDPAEQPVHETGRVVSTVFQNPRTQFFCTDPRSEMAFGSENAGQDPDDIRDRVARVAGVMGIEDLVDRSMFDLSGGQKQRVAVAAAVCDQPRLYLLDEPTSNLDDEAVDDLRAALEKLRIDGATIVIAEHRLYYLHGIVDRVIRLDGGRIAEALNADEFWTMPDDQRRRLGLRTLNPPTGMACVGTDRDADDAAYDEDEGTGLRCDHPRFGELFFPRGNVTTLVGRNGVGKSYTARSLAGLEKPPVPTSLDGMPLNRRDRVRQVFLVMQDVNRQLFAPSVREELVLGRRDIGQDVVDDAMTRLGIADLAERHPHALSGGQQQRVVVATALAEGRDVYIFDEPSSGLDYSSMKAVSGVLDQIAEAGKVVILITHDHELAAECTGRTITLTWQEKDPVDVPDGAGR